MHTLTIKRPADRILVASGLAVAVVVAGAIGADRIGSSTEPAPVVVAPAITVPTLDAGAVPGMPTGTFERLTVEQPTGPLDAGAVPGMPTGTFERLTVEQPTGPLDGPVPGMPSGTHRRLVEQPQQAVLDARPEPPSTLADVIEGVAP